MQGFNQGRYVPPEHEGTRTGNSLHGRRAAGTLRRDGTQTVRFEMPFAVWCHSCTPHALIGQGVRFNAVKARVGKYFSTPIWSFTLTHAACGGKIEIRTDPKETRYVVTSGGKARDYGEEKVGESGGEVFLTPEERERKREDAFGVLEEKKAVKEVERDGKRRVVELYGAAERDWKDPWAANARLRGGFRKERKRRVREESEMEEVKKRLGTDMEILPETEEDGKRAALVDFGGSEPSFGLDTIATGSALFRQPTIGGKAPSSRQSRPDAKSHKDVLRQRVLQNTRAAAHPFG